MLLNMAVADAYAIPFEFVSHTPDRPNDLKTYHRHPKYHELLTAQYTDDTQRSIANAEVVMWGDFLNARSYADAYVRVFQRDPREGYSKGYQRLMQSVSTTDEFLQTIEPRNMSNGSVMGAAVLGYIKDINMCRMAATVQACTTHNPKTAVHAQIVALAANFFIYDLGSKDELQSHVFFHATFDDDKSSEYQRWLQQIDDTRFKTTIRAASISAFVIGAIKRHDTLSGILREAVDRGGDTDSAAASAIAVASHCPEIENDLPDDLYSGLESGPYGIDFLKGMDARLKEYVAEQVDVSV